MKKSAAGNERPAAGQTMDRHILHPRGKQKRAFMNHHEGSFSVQIQFFFLTISTATAAAPTASTAEIAAPMPSAAPAVSPPPSAGSDAEPPLSAGGVTAVSSGCT